VWAPSWLAAGALGALLTYLLDPDHGRRRRSLARDRLGGSLRRAFRGFRRTARGAAADTYALAQQAQHLQPEHWSVPDDATLAQRVQTELFRDPEIPKGRITINAEAGIIVLRGELDRPEQIRAIEQAVSRMPGVRGVHNLLHLPGTPVPDRGSVLPAP
jgi:hypothetical protein